MKNIFLFLTLALLVSCAKKDDADIDIRKTISNAYPDIAVDEIKKIDENFHEIITVSYTHLTLPTICSV